MNKPFVLDRNTKAIDHIPIHILSFEQKKLYYYLYQFNDSLYIHYYCNITDDYKRTMDSHDGFIFVMTDVTDKVTSLVVYHTQCNLTIYH